MQILFNQHRKLRPLPWVRISRPPLGILHPQLLTLMILLQPVGKTPKRCQTAVDEVPGLLATNSVFCGIPFTISLPVSWCTLRSLYVEF